MKRYFNSRLALTFPALCFLTALTGISSPRQAMADDTVTPAAPPQVQPTFGAIAGVVRNSVKAPIPGAMVTAARSDGKGIWTTISGTDGIYSIPNITPGEYQVTTQAEGYPDAAVNTLMVAAGKATRTDIAMATSGPPQPAVISRTAPAPGNAAQSTWSRLLRPVMGSREQQPANTASLNGPPIAAFDRAAANAQGSAATPDAAVVPPAKPALVIPEALSAPDPGPAGTDTFTPFAAGGFTWLNGAPRNKDTVLDTKFFTPEVRFDTHYMEDYNQPSDHTIVGATESFRSGEVQIEQASIGGDFHWDNVRGRILLMYGLFATTTPRNDASSATGSGFAGNVGGVGQWDLQSAYKYVSEAYGGYHFNVQHGLNIDAGIFVSYIGLFSYYNYDNWTYQPSFLSSNTPWFFNGVRVQYFPTAKLKIEPWIINGWQSYNP